MPLPRYLLDEEEQDPFLTDNLDEPDDQPFDPNGAPRPFTAPPMRPFGDASPDMPEAPELSSPRSTVSPELQRIINANGPTAPPGNPPVIDEAQRRRKELADIQDQVPLQAAPKWWQRLGAGALGAAAGYTNAAKRTHVDPTAAVAGIMGVPDYQRKLAAHEAAVTGAQAQSNAANAAEAEWWKNRQLNNQERLQQAQEEQALAHGEYWRHQAEREQGQWKMNAKGILYNTTTGELHQPAATLAEKIADAKAAGLSPEEAKIYATGGKLGEPKPASNVNEWQTYLDAAGGDPKKALELQQAHKIAIARESRAPKSDVPKPPTSGQMVAIERKKNDRMNSAGRDAAREIEQMMRRPVIGQDGAQITDPVAVRTIREQQRKDMLANLELQKQTIQNEYEGEIHTATGNDPGHLELQPPPATTGGGRGAPAVSARPASKVATMQQVQAYAAKNNIPPDEALRRVKAEGFTVQ